MHRSAEASTGALSRRRQADPDSFGSLGCQLGHDDAAPRYGYLQRRRGPSWDDHGTSGLVSSQTLLPLEVHTSANRGRPVLVDLTPLPEKAEQVAAVGL